jgi:hypothetical protein
VNPARNSISHPRRRQALHSPQRSRTLLKHSSGPQAAPSNPSPASCRPPVPTLAALLPLHWRLPQATVTPVRGDGRAFTTP